jgi:hypothetical protein
MTNAVVLFATAGGIIPPSPSEQEIWNSFDPPEFTEGSGDFWLYRERTVGMLRRYMRLSVEVGRLPSLLGREFFRTRVTSYSASTFEDAVIFVHDVDRSLEKLDWLEKELIGKIILQEYSQDEAAILLGCWRRTVSRRLVEAIDRLTGIFLEGGLLTALPEQDLTYSESCQEEETEENSATDSE